MDQITYPAEKYTYYVQRLLLNDPTTEPTEFITTPSYASTLSPSFVPTPSVLSSNSYEPQYILETSVKASIITSVITTYFVFFFSYCCIVLRAKLKRRYLSGSGSGSSHSSYSDSTCTKEDDLTEKQEPFWFNDVYNESKECADNIA